MLYSVRPLLNVSGKWSTGEEQTLKDQLKHDEKTAVKLNERLTHIPSVFLRVPFRFL